jgi:hypothetical protein
MRKLGPDHDSSSGGFLKRTIIIAHHSKGQKPKSALASAENRMNAGGYPLWVKS